MKTIKKNSERLDMKIKLSLLWLVAMLTYTYGDVVTLMDPAKHGSMQLTQGFLLGASVFMAVPIVFRKDLSIPGRKDHLHSTMYHVFFTAIEVASTVFSGNHHENLLAIGVKVPRADNPNGVAA